ncbi:MAG TPA: hypothetical protein VNG12_14500 [Acidimicrobiales bacterium]|nr:hypothetical protein [Acidimicrobiales bacterium]
MSSACAIHIIRGTSGANPPLRWLACGTACHDRVDREGQRSSIIAIERWAEATADDDEMLAVVVAGSLTKGYGLADSDVDGFVIVDDEAFARRRASGEITFFSAQLCDYEGGYVDAKYVDRAFLEAVVERGSEPAKRDDPYLAGWAASRLALFACRLVLAHNRVLYPYRKWLLRTVAEVPDRPDDFVDLVRALAIERTPAAAEAVVMSLLLFRQWPQAPTGWSTQFMLDCEWNWLDGEPPIDDL